MIDIDEIRKRTEESMRKCFEKSKKLVDEIEVPSQGEDADSPDTDTAEALNASNERQVEILGQIFSADAMAQMAASEELLKKMVEEKVAEATASAEGNIMEQLFGEDMGILAAALEMLDTGDADEDGPAFSLEMEETLYAALEDAMARIESLPEPEPIAYQKDDAKWNRFGILLSGIVSDLNDHDLSGMDVEEHIPVMEQKIVSIVRRSWGINGRSELLDMIRYLAQDGYIMRYQLYAEASSPEELMDETMDEDDCESTRRAWRFAQRYKNHYSPDFMAGWDTGRAAMLTRWGCYLGWITENEAVGILWDLSHRAAEKLHSWREFAESYLFGGLMWKLLCGDSSAGSYLGYIANAATNLLIGKTEDNSGQWRDCPWPARRKIGFV